MSGSGPRPKGVKGRHKKGPGSGFGRGRGRGRGLWSNASSPGLFQNDDSLLLGGANKSRVLKLLNRTGSSGSGTGRNARGSRNGNPAIATATTAPGTAGITMRSSLSANPNNFGRLTLDPLDHRPRKNKGKHATRKSQNQIPTRRKLDGLGAVRMPNGTANGNGNRTGAGRGNVGPPRLAWGSEKGASASDSATATAEQPLPLQSIQRRPNSSGSAGSPINVVRERKAQRSSGSTNASASTSTSAPAGIPKSRKYPHPQVPTGTVSGPSATGTGTGTSPDQRETTRKRKDAVTRRQAKEEKRMHEKILQNLHVMPLSFLHKYRDHPDY